MSHQHRRRLRAIVRTRAWERQEKRDAESCRVRLARQEAQLERDREDRRWERA